MYTRRLLEVLHALRVKREKLNWLVQYSRVVPVSYELVFSCTLYVPVAYSQDFTTPVAIDVPIP